MAVPAVFAAGKLRGLVSSDTQLDLATATASTFRPYIGGRFHTSDQGVPLRLDRVESFGPLVFALRFTSPVGANLAQGTYVLKHEQLGTFPLFIVAHGADNYEAVFNHQAAV